MLELTVKEILDLKRTTSSKDYPIKYLPKAVVDRASDVLHKKSPEDVARYILYSFYVFRETVYRHMFMPYYEQDDCYEWPIPARFSWGNMDAVCAIGESLHGPIPNNQNKIVIEAQKNKKILRKTIDPDKGTIEEGFRDQVQGIDNFHKIFRYSIEDPSKIIVLFSNDWQIKSLQYYAKALHLLAVNCSEGAIEEKDSKKMLTNALENLRIANIRFD